MIVSWAVEVRSGDRSTSPVPVAALRRADGRWEAAVPLAGPCRQQVDAFPGFDAAGRPRVTFVDSGLVSGGDYAFPSDTRIRVARLDAAPATTLAPPKVTIGGRRRQALRRDGSSCASAARLPATRGWSPSSAATPARPPACSPGGAGCAPGAGMTSRWIASATSTAQRARARGAHGQGQARRARVRRGRPDRPSAAHGQRADPAHERAALGQGTEAEGGPRGAEQRGSGGQRGSGSSSSTLRSCGRPSAPSSTPTCGSL